GVQMFDSLSGKLSEVFDKLRRRGALSEADVSDALREIRLALLDADVAPPLAAPGGTAVPLNLLAPAPLPILMVGLQGSGKTTTSGKIALRLKTRERRKVLLASLDTQRPAAQLQLEQLAQRAEVT